MNTTIFKKYWEEAYKLNGEQAQPIFHGFTAFDDWDCSTEEWRSRCFSSKNLFTHQQHSVLRNYSSLATHKTIGTINEGTASNLKLHGLIRRTHNEEVYVELWVHGQRLSYFVFDFNFAEKERNDPHRHLSDLYGY